jgi:hypothetical protein
MPRPAPARFDRSDRVALRLSLWTSLGPLVTLGVLLAGYALSRRDCEPGIRWLIGGCLAAAALGCGSALFALWRAERSSLPLPAAGRRLSAAAIGLQGFCLLVLLGFAIVLRLRVNCG